MVDGASPQYCDVFDPDPPRVVDHGSHAGVAPPVIAINTSFPYEITGNGIALDLSTGLVLYDLQMPVSAGGCQEAG